VVWIHSPVLQERQQRWPVAIHETSGLSCGADVLLALFPLASDRAVIMAKIAETTGKDSPGSAPLGLMEPVLIWSAISDYRIQYEAEKIEPCVHLILGFAQRRLVVLSMGAGL